MLMEKSIDTSYIWTSYDRQPHYTVDEINQEFQFCPMYTFNFQFQKTEYFIQSIVNFKRH